MDNIPSTDNHIHVDPINGEGPLEVASKFHRSGGTAMIIPNKPTWTVNPECNFVEAMELVVKYADEINQETEVKAFAVVGAHPAELSRRVEAGMDLAQAEELMRGALEAAKNMVMEGRAVGIGEIGRPHYPVPEEEMEVHNRLIIYAMELAREADCPVQLHTESASEEQYHEFAEMAKKAHLKEEKVIKHFSGPFILPEENYGITPSLIASGDVMREAVKKGKNFLMETDYLDDKTRPGAVMGPRTVPRRTRKLINAGLLTEEDAYRIHVEIPERIYNVEMDL
ncbi:TatD family hydrolase [Methanobacterium petrolearium]|uniref:TatD family hydrolase n=1 Tax=Methanobacterium petrolearium TaxID=710190 RepID=UPI001AE498DC|nr:TatD family hydrolase [Methanobacterium petrolearium]MBP1945730.1 TatD-related deoxyribonuclease [Methanobacterium petrolearium]BDZ71978.1 deoxyribonuclease [Methanobacterium petrolearium]